MGWMMKMRRYFGKTTPNLSKFRLWNSCLNVTSIPPLQRRREKGWPHMKIFNYLQEYKREKPVNQQDKLIQTHYPQTEHSPKSQQKRYFISHDKVRIIYFQAKVCRNTRCAFFFFIDYKNRLIFLSCDILRISLIYAFSTSK